MRLRDVRVESRQRDQSRVGITALVDDGEHTLVQFGVRRWPGDGSAHELAWTVVDRSHGTELEVRGGGLGGGVHPTEGAALDGGVWFDQSATGLLRIQCRHRDEVLIDVDLPDGHLEPIPSPVTGFDLPDADGQRWRGIMSGLEAAGWRRGRAVADDIVALDARQPTTNPLGVVPFAVERWGRLVRIAIAIDESDDPDYPPRWWAVEIGGHVVDALGEHFQSGRSANLIGHLVMVDPAPRRPLEQF